MGFILIMPVSIYNICIMPKHNKIINILFNNTCPLMAWFEVDIFNRCVEVDLHDYSRMTAIQVAREKIKEAYEHGFRYVRLIHGASNIRHKEDGGSIKFALRSMLNKGGLNNWAEEKGSKNHRLREESMILALRKNPKPVGGEWKEMPMDEY